MRFPDMDPGGSPSACISSISSAFCAACSSVKDSSGEAFWAGPGSSFSTTYEQIGLSQLLVHLDAISIRCNHAIGGSPGVPAAYLRLNHLGGDTKIHFIEKFARSRF